MKRYLIPIIVSAVSLVVMTVVTYAYFTATIDPSGETTATLRTATVGTVTFVTESPSSNLTNVYPGWEGEGSTTVYFNTNSDDDVAYHCTVQLIDESYSTNVYVQTLSGSDAQVPTETALTEQGVIISQGTLEAQSNISSPNHGTEHVVTYKIIFKEIGEAQNDDQGKTINTYTTCVIDQQSGSALTLVSGTMTDLSGDPIANQAMVAFSSPTYFTTDVEGHYSVRLYSGEHNIYYVPGMSMEDLVEEGKDIQTNENVVTKSVTVTAGNTQTLNPVVNINAPTKTVSITCTNCTIDGETTASQSVTVGEDASFDVLADSGYTLEGATVTGNCTLSNGMLTLTNVSDDASCSVSASHITLVSKMLSDNSIKSRSSFSGNFVENTTGNIYSTLRTDDSSTVYYYAGNTTNNWVIFGKSGSSYLYWRIIRTNTDAEGGGVRLLYSGSGSSATTIPDNLTNALVTTLAYESTSGSSSAYYHVGFKYEGGKQHGHSTSSDALINLNNWYSARFSSSDALINKKAVYCNDRSVNGTWSTSTSSYNYAAYTRISNSHPTYKCGGNTSGGYYESAANRLEDKFSVIAGPGNGYLTNPIGLITADEIVFAGGKGNLTSPYTWFYTNGKGKSITGTTSWWTMTPYNYNSYNNGSNMYYIDNNSSASNYGMLYYVRTGYSEIGLRPVLSLISSAAISNSDADGTINHPYIISN